jgi:HD-GYP domain-containing protein (c-di-GMP phosphodiesterase class II)
MAHPLIEIDEEAVINRVGDAFAIAANGRPDTVGEDEHTGARRVGVVATAMLNAIEAEVAPHSDDVEVIAGAIARWLGVSGRGLEDLLVAARLHDIGKLAIPAAILSKPTPLDPVEWVAIRRHPIIGEQILVWVPQLRGSAPLIRHSHERWDGTGYPDGLAGEAIPLGSRIIFCANAFDAIRSDRPYRPGCSAAEALAEIRACAGTQFDPAVVEALESLAAGGLRLAPDRIESKPHRVRRLVAWAGRRRSSRRSRGHAPRG